MSYTSFTNYFRNVNPLKIEGLIKSTGIGKEILKYEQLTISSAPVTVSNPFTPMSGWDAVAQVAGPNFPYLLQASQFPDEFTSSLTHLTRCPRIQTADSLSFVRLMNEDVPNFVNVDAGYQVLPVDVVSFQIPK
ncbi:hypothetical protein PQX77_009080 [Marasmius sp. AFHP31]|nr:hypothetical protein PQX77_009080 [Marasmius sp. AFHP31]